MTNFYKIAFGESGRGAWETNPPQLDPRTVAAGNQVGGQNYRVATGQAPVRDPSNPEVQLGDELQAQRNNPLVSGRPSDEQMTRMGDLSRAYQHTARPRTPEQVAEWERFTNEGKPVYDRAAKKWTMPPAAQAPTAGGTDWATVAQQNWASQPPAAPAAAKPGFLESAWNWVTGKPAPASTPSPAAAPPQPAPLGPPPPPVAITPPKQVVGTGERTPAQMANMSANYQNAGLPVPKQFTPAGAPGMAKINSAEPTWFGVVKQAIAPSYDALKLQMDALKARLGQITNDRVRGNAEMNARLDVANKALDNPSKSPEIGPGIPYVRNAGLAAVYQNQHNAPVAPLTTSQLERNADVAGAGSGLLTDAGKLGLTMPGRGEQLNGVEKPTSDPRIQGARLVEALKAAKRMNLPFTAEHFMAGYVDPETVLREDAKRGIPARRPPTRALPYAIPFAGR